VRGIERVREWQVELMPGMLGPKLQAEPGYEIAVIHLALKSVAPGAKNLDVKTLGIVDAGGQSYRCVIEATDICDLGPQGEATCQLPCSVPESVAIAAVKSGATTVKLEPPVPAPTAEREQASNRSSQAKSTAVTIIGTLVERNLSGGLVPPRVFPIAVAPEDENNDSVTVTTDALNKYFGTVATTGDFQLSVERSFVPPGKRLRLMVMFVDDRRLQPVKANGENVVLTIGEDATTIRVGKVTTK
jgi:hypothetical protein